MKRLSLLLLCVFLLTAACGKSIDSATGHPPVTVLTLTPGPDGPYPYPYPYPYPNPNETWIPSTNPAQTALPSVLEIPTAVDQNLFHTFDLSFIDAQTGWIIGAYSQEPQELEIQFTHDAGQQWVIQHLYPTPGVIGLQAKQIRFANSKDGWAFSPGLFTTHDGGNNWSIDSVPSVTTQTVAVVPGPETVWAIEQLCPNPGVCHYVLRKGPISGKWEGARSGLPATGRQLLLVRQGEMDAWLLDAQEDTNPHPFFVSHDGGANWQKLPDIQSGTNCWMAVDLSVLSDQLWLLCGGIPATNDAEKRLFVSLDGGKVWQLRAAAYITETSKVSNLPLSGQPDSLSAAAPNHLFIALTRGPLLGSFDGGQTWRQLLGLLPNEGAPTRIVFTDPQHGFAAWQYILLVTVNGGENWKAVPIP